MRAVLLAGGNLGDVEEALQAACGMIERQVGRIAARSQVYRSVAWGFQAEESFLNQAIVVQTALAPEALLDAVERIECALGREKKGAAAEEGQRTYASRTMDIDIIFYGDQTIHTPRLRVPHPLAARRRFVLEPLAEIMPGYVHPDWDESIETLLGRL